METYGLENLVVGADINNAPISNEWKTIFNEMDNDKRNKLVIEIWKQLEFNEIVACFTECLTTVQLELVDGEYKIVYLLCEDVKYYGNVNANVLSDMNEKFGGEDPLLLEFVTKLHDGFYAEDHYYYECFLAPISEMETIEEGCFLDGEYVEEERFDAEEFEEAGVILNEETQDEFAEKTICVARTNHMFQICRNTDHLNYYFDWDTKGDFALKRAEEFISDLQNVIVVGLEDTLS